MSRLDQVVLPCFVVIGVAVWFLAQTVLVDGLADALVVAASATGAFLTAMAAAPFSRRAYSTMTRSALAMSAAAGALMGFVSPYLLIANRLTDAPPGSEVLFFTTAGWAVMCALAAYATTRERPTTGQLALMAVGVLGVATLVANWERPSSFSPLVRYATQETWMLVAGASWAAGSLILAHAGASSNRRVHVVVAAATAALLANAWALVSARDGVSALRYEIVPAVVLAVAFGAVFVIWPQLNGTFGLTRSASFLLLPAFAVTGFGVVEQALTPRGPDPVIWIGAMGGAGLSLMAVGALLISGRVDGIIYSRRWSVLHASALAGACIAVLLGIAALALPAISASVSGTLHANGAYNVRWALAGWESAGGWSTALAGLLLLSASVAVLTGQQRSAWIYGAAAALTVAAYPLVRATPLRTWNRWVPVELQSEYGTEYVSLNFGTVDHPVRLASLACTVFGLAMLVLVLVRARRTGGGNDDRLGASK